MMSCESLGIQGDTKLLRREVPHYCFAKCQIRPVISQIQWTVVDAHPMSASTRIYQLGCDVFKIVRRDRSPCRCRKAKRPERVEEGELMSKILRRTVGVRPAGFYDFR
ncbi:hypothetical protein CAL25_19955 [Bordetella genomosp. 5]|uniref:Uncharacterized protein n=1 Tax=Bordetella genomosp. 5 TaxID=1395608 RepID=A0A261TCY1_9BORD|nr:hypothetical protein CAL25_19955 [Bordetella genomosp. 5]